MSQRLKAATLAVLCIAIGNGAFAQTTRVSVATGGAQATGGDSQDTAISADGRFVAFSSRQPNLVGGDTNNATDVFVHDRQTGQTTRVSVASVGGQGYGSNDSHGPAISATGRYVAFVSDQTNLAEGDTNGMYDVFVHDRETATTTRVSVASNGDEAFLPWWEVWFTGSFEPDINEEGRYVVFKSEAANLVAGDTNNVVDVFLHDRETATTIRVNIGAGGIEADGESFEPAISADGRVIVYSSYASNLVPGDTSGSLDVFLFDRTTGQTERVNLTSAGTPANGPCAQPSVSADGMRVAFSCFATNVVPDNTTLQSHVYVRDRRTATTTLVSVGALGPGRGGTVGTPAISADGRFVAFQSSATNLVLGDTNGRFDIFVRDIEANDTIRVDVGPGVVQGGNGYVGSSAPSLSSSGQFVAFISDHSNLVPGDTNGTADAFVSEPAVIPRDDPRDDDTDSLLDTWERRFGLNPASGAGNDGASGDPDGDGKTNAQEYAAGTHPRGFETRYLAEGVTGWFDVAFSLLNPGTTAASALLRFQKADGTTAGLNVTVPPRTRRTVVPKSLAGLADTSFSTVVESDALVVVDRTMTWGGGYGSHAEKAVLSPSPTWYLAEGATSGAFQLFYLLQNPNPTTTSVKVRYLRPAGAPVERTYPLPPSSRTTIYVDTIDELASTDVSAVFEATQPIIVERAMYLDRPGGELFSAGHASAGVTAPATSWFLAEGATGRFFDLYVLLANPTGQPAAVQVRYLTDSGAVYEKPYTLAPTSRTTIWVDVEEFPGLGEALQEAAVSTTVTSTNGVPIIVERAMWWPDGAWHEAHNSPGATATGTRWALAEGEVGGPTALETYVLIANTSATPGAATVMLHFEDGTTATTTVPLLPNSRTNVQVSTEFPQAANRKFGVVVESLGPSPAQIVVERAMYSDANGVFWAAGTNALATRLQ